MENIVAKLDQVDVVDCLLSLLLCATCTRLREYFMCSRLSGSVRASGCKCVGEQNWMDRKAALILQMLQSNVKCKMLSLFCHRNLVYCKTAVPVKDFGLVVAIVKGANEANLGSLVGKSWK